MRFIRNINSFGDYWKSYEYIKEKKFILGKTKWKDFFPALFNYLEENEWIIADGKNTFKLTDRFKNTSQVFYNCSDFNIIEFTQEYGDGLAKFISHLILVVIICFIFPSPIWFHKHNIDYTFGVELVYNLFLSLYIQNRNNDWEDWEKQFNLPKQTDPIFS